MIQCQNPLQSESHRPAFQRPLCPSCPTCQPKSKLNVYDKNGMGPERIRGVLEKGCKCPLNCLHQFKFDDIHNLCCVYHRLHEDDRKFMLHTMYTKAAWQASGPEVHSPGPRSRIRHDWYILGHKVCVPGFCNLLGISCKTYTTTSDLPSTVGADWTKPVPCIRGEPHS